MTNEPERELSPAGVGATQTVSDALTDAGEVFLGPRSMLGSRHSGAIRSRGRGRSWRALTCEGLRRLVVSFCKAGPTLNADPDFIPPALPAPAE